jgi:hypothetical protein
MSFDGARRIGQGLLGSAHVHTSFSFAELVAYVGQRTETLLINRQTLCIDTMN